MASIIPIDRNASDGDKIAAAIYDLASAVREAGAPAPTTANVAAPSEEPKTPGLANAIKVSGEAKAYTAPKGTPLSIGFDGTDWEEIGYMDMGDAGDFGSLRLTPEPVPGWATCGSELCTLCHGGWTGE